MYVILSIMESKMQSCQAKGGYATIKISIHDYGYAPKNRIYGPMTTLLNRNTTHHPLADIY